MGPRGSTGATGPTFALDAADRIVFCNVAAEAGVPAPASWDCNKLVFVSSNSHTGNLGGVEGADAICQADAVAAGIPGTFKAWISSASSSPSSRFTHSPYPYQLANGTRIANNWADLTDGALAAAIDRWLGGSQIVGYIWTGTKANGTHAGNDCAGWTSSASAAWGYIGSSEYASANWTFLQSLTCDARLALYCFQQ